MVCFRPSSAFCTPVYRAVGSWRPLPSCPLLLPPRTALSPLVAAHQSLSSSHAREDAPPPPSHRPCLPLVSGSRVLGSSKAPSCWLGPGPRRGQCRDTHAAGAPPPLTSSQKGTDRDSRAHSMTPSLYGADGTRSRPGDHVPIEPPSLCTEGVGTMAFIAWPSEAPS